ncbi:MAG: DEAD/DEAH box helicase family protein, partial [Anaerolineales bacterium]|nr:DEAD/DEAH box helicase family protein [Anaerolineales bacterium]
MSTTYVAVDVETTGLDAGKDTIIEVAAITFQNADILDEFSSLVNPQRDVPPFITQLTGITQAMVDDAPSMFTLRSRLRSIIGDHVLVGHNIGFDAAFLQEERLGIGNHRVDTVTLASILYPEAGRFNLESLVRFLGLPNPGGEQSHRALDDAEQTVELFLALKEKALTLDFDILNEIVQSGRFLGWRETIFFEDVLTLKAKQAFDGDKPPKRGGRLARLYQPTRPKGQLLAPKESPDPLDVDIVSSMIRPGGNFDHAFPDFEYRPQQVQMLEIVATSFNDGSHLMVEAGTGTGKSVAYLLPAAFWAHENGRRVVISTNTINLQDQLINKDIPELQRLLPFELRAAVRKGRSNYLCTRLFQQMRHSGPGSADEMVLYARILQWLPTTENGDVAELTLRTPGERIAWSRLNGENATCTSDQCAAENCPLHIAKRRAELAHLVVVNHSLLLADVARNNLVLPEFVDLIVDEAHHLESAVTDGLSFRADRRFLEAILDEVTSPRSGLIADMQKRVGASISPEAKSKLDTVVNGMRKEAQYAAERLDEFFMTLSYFFADKINRRSQFSQQIRITPAVRSQPDYDELELSWDNLSKNLHGIADGFHKLSKGLGELVDDIEGVEELVLSLMSNGRSLEETRANLDHTILEPQADMIYWVDIFKDRISLHAAPLHVGPLVEEHIFGAKETVILTSATMRTAGPDAREEANFTYIRDRLHAFDVDDMAVGSPFDYKNNTLLYLVSDMPEPNQPGYQ